MSTTFKSAESTDIQALPRYSLYSAYSSLAIYQKKDWVQGLRHTLDYLQVGISVMSVYLIGDRVCIGPDCRDSRTAKWLIYSFYCAKQYC